MYCNFRHPFQPIYVTFNQTWGMPWILLSVDIMFRKKALHKTPFASYFYRTRTMRNLPFRKHRLFWHTSQRKGYKYHNKNFGQSLKVTLLKILVFCSLGTSNSRFRFLRWHIFMCILQWTVKQWLSLQWRHNGHDSVSNHQPHDCLLNRLFRRRSKKTSKLRVTGLWDRWIPRTNGQLRGKCFHLMTSSCVNTFSILYLGCDHLSMMGSCWDQS